MLNEHRSFKNNVTIVEIENTSFCNRSCVYCINSSIDKHSINHILDDELFRKVINQLAEIEYNRIVTFHRFNEPFYLRNELILNRIIYARSKLPRAILIASTNGDYLNASYLKQLSDAGLDELYIQYHYSEYPNNEIIKKDIIEYNERIGNYRGSFFKKDGAIVFFAINSPFNVLTISSKNYSNDGYDRGGVLDLACKHECSGCCYGPTTTLTIDSNGKVNMCCNLVSYVESHKQFVLGDIAEKSIFDIYEFEKNRMLRKEIALGKRASVCKFCSCNYKSFLQRFNINPKSLIF